jgi:hypothetical protein
MLRGSTHMDANRGSITTRQSLSGKLANIVGMKTATAGDRGSLQPVHVAPRNMKDVIVEGFITMNLVSDLKNKHWERRYVVLNYRGQMTYYKNRYCSLMVDIFNCFLIYEC